MQRVEGSSRRPEGGAPHPLLHSGSTGLRPPLPDPPRSAPSDSIDGRLLRYMVRTLGNPPVRVSLWNGATVSPAPGSPMAHVDREPRSLLKLLADPSSSSANASATARSRSKATPSACSRHRPVRSATALSVPAPRRMIERLRRRRANTPSDSPTTSIITTISARVLPALLDRQLLHPHTPVAGVTLEAAQAAKMDQVCRKLRLQPEKESWKWVALGRAGGTWPPDMASGWHTTSHASRSPGEGERACRVEGRVEFIEDDYRNIRGNFDAFVLTGMPHGGENYGELGKVIDKALQPDGRGLIHSTPLPAGSAERAIETIFLSLPADAGRCWSRALPLSVLDGRTAPALRADARALPQR